MDALLPLSITNGNGHRTVGSDFSEDIRRHDQTLNFFINCATCQLAFEMTVEHSRTWPPPIGVESFENRLSNSKTDNAACRSCSHQQCQEHEQCVPSGFAVIERRAVNRRNREDVYLSLTCGEPILMVGSAALLLASYVRVESGRNNSWG